MLATFSAVLGPRGQMLVSYRTLEAAGSWAAHENAHRAALQAIFAPKFTHLLPPELVARVVEYSFHLGFY